MGKLDISDNWESEEEPLLKPYDTVGRYSPELLSTPVRQLEFETLRMCKDKQTEIQSKLLEIQLTEAVHKQTGVKEKFENHSGFMVKAAKNADLPREAITRLAHKCTGHAISTEATEKK